nr:M20/M25/M40 family metallo-hydrolase [Acinetobacter cumulans]
MMEHLQALQDIAVKHAGNRAVGTAGGLASAKYIMNEAKEAGFQAQMIAFENRAKVVGQNIIVEIKGKNIDDAVIVGAHYDSVKTGPGINDNGSGTALLLELIHHYAKPQNKPNNTVYLAFWDSEEEGIGGSQAFVKNLTPSQLQHTLAYINVDMVGTKNPDIMIADVTKSSVDEMEKMLKERGMNETEYKPLLDGLRAIPVHAGDLALEKQLSGFFQQKGITVKKDVSTLTASDTAPFLGKVPVASIILFDEQLKGDVLEFAPCYHQECDSIDLVDPASLSLASEAVLHLMQSLEK